MQEVEFNDGRRIREFFHATNEQELREGMAKRYLDAMANSEGIKSIKQLRIERNEQCPCGSGKKFKLCCMRKVNQGPEEVR